MRHLARGPLAFHVLADQATQRKGGCVRGRHGRIGHGTAKRHAIAPIPHNPLLQGSAVVGKAVAGNDRVHEELQGNGAVVVDG